MNWCWIFGWWRPWSKNWLVIICRCLESYTWNIVEISSKVAAANCQFENIYKEVAMLLLVLLLMLFNCSSCLLSVCDRNQYRISCMMSAFHDCSPTWITKWTCWARNIVCWIPSLARWRSGWSWSRMTMRSENIDLLWHAASDDNTDNSNNNTRTVFMVLSSWLGIIRVHAVQCQMAADLWTKPTDLSHRPVSRWLGYHIHHRHLLSLKADTHFA